MLYRPMRIGHQHELNEEGENPNRKLQCERDSICSFEAAWGNWEGFSCNHCPGVAEGMEVQVEEEFVYQQEREYDADGMLLPRKECVVDGQLYCAFCGDAFLPQYEGQSRCFKCRKPYVGRKKHEERNTEIVQLRDAGWSYGQIAKKFRLSKTTIGVICSTAKLARMREAV